MGKKEVTVTETKTRIEKETVEVLICDLCGREAKNGAKRYFGYPADQTSDDQPKEAALITNSFIACGECNERLQ